MLEFYFMFQFWPHYSHQRVILHQQQPHITTMVKPNFIQVETSTLD